MIWGLCLAFLSRVRVAGRLELCLELSLSVWSSLLGAAPSVSRSEVVSSWGAVGAGASPVLGVFFVSLIVLVGILRGFSVPGLVSLWDTVSGGDLTVLGAFSVSLVVLVGSCARFFCSWSCLALRRGWRGGLGLCLELSLSVWS